MPETRTEAGKRMLNRRIARRSGLFSGPYRRSIGVSSAGTEAFCTSVAEADVYSNQKTPEGDSVG
jgi:hypothetical protein